MDNRYKLIISNKNLYKEADLPVEQPKVKVGTTSNCEIRLNKVAFFDQFEITLEKRNDIWNVVCSDNVYITLGDVRKLLTKELKHGDVFSVRYKDSDSHVINVQFLLDFDYEQKNYERIIDVSKNSFLSVGGRVDCNIILSSPYISDDYFQMTFSDKHVTLECRKSLYGVFHNGKKVEQKTEIRNGDFISIANFSFYYKKGKLYTSKYSKLQFNGISYIDVVSQKSAFIYPKFNRNSRVRIQIPEDKITVLDPPAKPQKPKVNVIQTLMPALGMIAITIVLRGLMSNSMGSSYIWFSVATMGMGIFTSVFGFISGKKEYKTSIKERTQEYTQYIADKKQEIGNIRKEELDILNDIYYNQDRNIKTVKDFTGNLFDRTEEDADFLDICLGYGEVEAKRKIDYKYQERFATDDDLVNKPEELANEFAYIHNAPVIIKLKQANAVGFVGKKELLYAFLKNLTLDICIRQFYGGVKLFYVVDESNKKLIEWVRFLPHVQNTDLNMRNIVCDSDSKGILFEYLYKELSRRQSEKTSYPHFVILIFDEMGFNRHPVSKFVSQAQELNVSFVFFVEHSEFLPLHCNEIVDIRDNQTASLLQCEDRNEETRFTYREVEDSIAASVAIKLSPVYCEEVSLESSLTKNISLFQLLNIFAVDDLNLKSRWASSRVYESMAAPLGVKTKNEIVALDLHEKAHGPHGLVAGTTGSGKSEILQSYILSMATLFHPYEVSFVIIDFKGGGMVNQFKELPHLVGAITNIDGKEINRSLLSIKAELTKRQNLFAQAGVNHIDKYIRLFQKGEVATALPHLIIIVDEFAELKAEQPEFMKELISAARIGRSLGVHLILATQKPAGQVNEQIWSNSKFKLCLKVQTQEDSNEVIKSPLAAEIVEPGRAYFQVGNNEIFELFQSAYSGSPEKIEDNGNRFKEYYIAAVDLSGKRKIIFHQKKSKNDKDAKTQLAALVEYVHDYCAQEHIKKLPDICLPPLGKTIEFSNESSIVEKNYDMTVGIGIYDDPNNQYQGLATIDIGAGNTIIIGSSQYGKTNLLQSVIRSLATQYTPDEVNIYIIDFASMVLKNFETLNHVGGVVCSSDDEKLKNLFKLLKEEMEARKEKLMAVGVSSFASYKEADKTDLPQIVLIIDNLTMLKELYLQDDEVLLNICREGLSVGISIIIANSQTAGIGYRYLSNFASRIALFCNDNNEYNSLFDYCKIKPEDLPGRCIIEVAKSHLECQSFLAFNGEKEIERVNAMKDFIQRTNAKNEKKFAKIIPVIPALLTRGFTEQQYAGHFEKNKIVIGLDYDTVTPFVFDLSQLGVLAVSGRQGSGKANFMKYMVWCIDKYNPDADIHIIDNVQKKFNDIQNVSAVRTYSYDYQKTEDILTAVYEKAKMKFENMLSGNDVSQIGLQLVLINNTDAIEHISNNKKLLDMYKELIGKYASMGVCFILGDIPNAQIAYGAPEVYKILKEKRHFMFFEDLSNLKIYDMPITVLRQYKKPIGLGDAYYMKDNECNKVKTVFNVE